MPQIRNTTTEDYGADDEVKEYKQDEDENAVNETNVDVVNDLKSDLIKKDAERIEAKRDNRPVFPHFGAIASPHQTEIFRPMISGPPRAFPRQDSPYYSERIWHPNRQHIVYGSPQYPGHYPNAIPVNSADGSMRRPPGNITDEQRCGHLVAAPMNTSVICHTSISGLPNSQGNHGNLSGTHENGHEKKVHVKKPLNAFMLYMKEMRSKVISECTLKESAAINQILGKRWHQLDRAEQAKYYDQARRERAIHMQMYPGWSARENYAQQGKKKKRKRDKSQGDASEANNPKKCRARYGLDRQHEWCKPCRRKKKCIRFVAGNPNPQDIGENEEGGAVTGTGAESTAASTVNMGVDLIKPEPLS